MIDIKKVDEESSCNFIEVDFFFLLPIVSPKKKWFKGESFLAKSVPMKRAKLRRVGRTL
jgi:hypothetical protein